MYLYNKIKKKDSILIQIKLAECATKNIKKNNTTIIIFFFY